jgi:hypothetical protein
MTLKSAADEIMQHESGNMQDDPLTFWDCFDQPPASETRNITRRIKK